MPSQAATEVAILCQPRRHGDRWSGRKDHRSTSGINVGYQLRRSLSTDRVTATHARRIRQTQGRETARGIEQSKSRGPARLLSGISIRHVGARVSSILAKKYGSLWKLAQASAADLSEIDEIGPIIAQSIFDFFNSEYGRQTLDDLAKVGVRLEDELQPAGESETPATPQLLAGKTLVVTGTLLHFKRDEIERLIESLGGRASSSVSSSTDYLVAGEKAGSKLAKAQSLGVTVLSEEEFRKMIEAGS